jgi:hypothetical protein
VPAAKVQRLFGLGPWTVGRRAASCGRARY